MVLYLIAVSAFVAGSIERLSRQLDQIGLLPQAQRSTVARDVFLAIRTHLQSKEVKELRELRRRVQDKRAILIYQGARDFTNLHFAAATMIDQWAASKLESLTSPSLTHEVLAERRCRMIDKFVQENLPDDLVQGDAG